MRPFHQSKRSDNKRHNSYNSAMTVIAQDDHLTAGAWAACDYFMQVPLNYPLKVSPTCFDECNNGGHVIGNDKQ